MAAYHRRAPLHGVQEVTEWTPRSPLDRVASAISTSIGRTGHMLAYIVLAAFLYFWLRPWWTYINTPLGWQFTAWSILPVVLLVGVVWLLDRSAKEPILQLADAFAFGAFVASVAAILNSHFAELHAALFFVLVVGPVEEIVKLIGVYTSSFRKASFDEREDGIIYGMATGAGFAAIENVTYVVELAGTQVGWQTLVGRLLITTPAHMAWTGYAAYYAGLAKWFPDQRATLIAKGLIVAIALHGAFDVLVVYGGAIGVAIGVFVNVCLLAYLVSKLKMQADAASLPG